MDLKRVDSNDPGFRELIPMLDTELRSRYQVRQDTYDTLNIIDYISTVVVVVKDSAPVGCGCFKKFDDHAVEIKRMFVKKEYRGKGIAVAVLRELEAWAKDSGYSYAVLETGTRQPEAIALYKKEGYSLIPNYGPYIDLPDSVCMKKTLMPIEKPEAKIL